MSHYEQQKTTVIQILCDKFNITKEGMFSKSRKREYSDARHFYSLWIRENSNQTLKEIGELLNKNYTTIIHSNATANDLLQTSEFHRNIYNLLPKLSIFPLMPAIMFRNVKKVD